MKALIMMLMVFSCSCFAGYTGNHNSKVAWVKIYNNDIIYFKLENMPADHQCAESFFGLSPSLTEAQRNRYYSMLLAAKASGAVVSVGYDKVNPDCISNRPVAHALLY